MRAALAAAQAAPHRNALLAVSVFASRAAHAMPITSQATTGCLNQLTSYNYSHALMPFSWQQLLG